MDRRELTLRIKEHALSLGFDAVAVTRAEAIPESNLLEWLRRGYHGEMGYMARSPEKRLDPGKVLEGARSVLTLALNYFHPYPLPYGRPDRGAISRYASGDDYHDVMGKLLNQLLERIQTEAPGTKGKAYVDTGPVLDKHWAARAGIGWLGKNANLLAKRKIGSWFFIGEILVDLELESDAPAADHCGTCTRCIEACPTDAIVQPYVVDSRRCISYLTIELKGDIPPEFRRPMANLVYGCDICQDVCPWNRKVEASRIDEFRPRPANRAPKLREMARMSEEEFRRQYKGSAVKRTKWRGLMRNVAVALGNSGDPEAVPELAALLDSREALVRRHAAWALGQIGGEPAVEALRSRLKSENDPAACREILQVLQQLDSGKPPRQTGSSQSK